MRDSLCRLTVAACADDIHRMVDLALPTDIHIAQLLPLIVDIVHPHGTNGRDWRLSRLGDLPLDDCSTLNDNDVRHGEVLLLTAIDPPITEWVGCDPCLAVAAGVTQGSAPVLRILPTVCCVLLGGLGALMLTRSAGTGDVLVGSCLAVAAATGAAVSWRLRADPRICVPLSLVTILYAGAVGFVSVPPGPTASGLLLASAAVLAAAVVLSRITRCGTPYLTAIATLSALIVAVAAAAATWRLQLAAGGAALVTLSLALLGGAPRLSMMLNRMPVDSAVPDVGSCHQTLTGLVMGSSAAAALGAASVAAGDGSALRGTAFAAVVALVLVLRMRTHVDPARRVGLAAAAMLAAAAGFAIAAASAPHHIPVISALATVSGAATLTCLAPPALSPMVIRAVEIIEYVALAAVVPLACWVAGVFGLVRGL
ncbi:type VII secretion integral membrane protein EccD [Mycobacterium barrassiae]|uniref:type VII secretion integral membrane protein EccD n=1 Tax=Mycobacterium barrassiae TaxID=319709 RepID=UPI0022659FD6|nr:type VII secretion integral membrane protein EccD [Mycobacterium barrassiae]MCV7302426.1 type VII secretion integral membrane protein EccD [Mycobacterium barrassiae]